MATLAQRLEKLKPEDREFALARKIELDLHFPLSPKQTEIKQAVFRDGYSHIFARKGRKGGGTEAMFYPSLLLAGCFRNKLIMMVYPDGPTIDKILSSTNRIKGLVPPEWKHRIQWSEKRRFIHFQDTDSRIEFIGAHDPDSLQGGEADAYFWDEFADHDNKAYEICYPNTMSREDTIWYINGAPPLDRTKFYYQVEHEAKSFPQKWFWIKWTARENPFLKSFDFDEARSRYYARGAGEIWEVQWEANDVIGGVNTVLRSFNRGRHIVGDHEVRALLAEKETRILWGVDPGYATCFASCCFAFNPTLLKIIVIGEEWERDRRKISVMTGSDSMWKRMQSNLYKWGCGNKVPVYIYDSAALGFASEVRRGHAIQPLLYASKKGKDDEEAYFRAWNALLSMDRFQIHKSCHNLITEVDTYLTDENGKYPDKNNHGLDATRYVLKYLKTAYPDLDKDEIEMQESLSPSIEDRVADFKRRGRPQTQDEESLSEWPIW